ncbi:MAG: ABC transporter ATP-binding protein [Firmicutes bacterium]|nr:ABC transporter ATP-binding protein [Dethiobacter sp.]MBS3887686.1 ABC transporter ATP-binding protein [Bacillota bacterium]
MIALKVIWRLLAARPYLYLLDVVLWTSVHALPLLPALLLRQTLDRLFAGDYLSPIQNFAIAMLAYALVRVVVITAGAATDAVHRFHTSSLLRYNVMRRIFLRPGAASLSVPPGEALDSIRDDATHLEYTVSWIADFLGELLFGVVAIAILAGINARVTVVVFLPLLVIGVIYNIASQALEKYRVATRDAAARVTGVMGEVFSAIQSLQMAQAEDRAANRLRELNTTRATLALRERKYNHGLEFLSNGTFSIGSAAILWVAGRELGGTSFTVGDFALFVSYLDSVTGIVEFYGYFVAFIQQGNVAVRRLAALCEDKISELTRTEHWQREAKVTERSRVPLQTLAVKGLSYIYPQSATGVTNISFDIAAGSLVAITGRMGSGKTTLLRAILGQLPGNGAVYWNEQPVTVPNEVLVPPNVAYVRQSPILFSGTLRDNLAMGGKFSDDDLRQALRKADFSTDLAALTEGLDTIVGVRGVKLSGGQVQRVAAARAIIHQPELLVFDDLSSALDVRTEENLWRSLFGEESRGTYLVVSHRPQVLRRADKIIVLKDGRVEDSGSYDDLVKRCEEFRRLLGEEA